MMDSARSEPSLRLEDFSVHLKRFAPSEICRWPRRVPGRVCVFLQGSMFEKRSGRDVSYEVSDLLYRPPEERPSLVFGERGARTVTIELLDAGISILRDRGFAIEAPFHASSPGAHRVAERMRSELGEPDEMSPLVLEGLVLELLGEAYRLRRRTVEPRPPFWLRRVREQLESEFARPRSLSEYALSAGVHRAHLVEAHRHHYRSSLGEYARSLKVGAAMRELADSDRPIAEVALAAGFSDQSHLTRIFKRATGLTPARFRRSRRNPRS